MLNKENFDYYIAKNDVDDCFSILIPSWNNLPYLKLCIESIKKNSTHKHQIIVHLNEGNDGSVEWIRGQEDISYTHTQTNVGVCYALNILATLATTNYILYMNDDMYVCPEWDQYLLEQIKSIGHDNFFVSATAIEPVPQSRCSIEGNFGGSIDSFEEINLLKQYSQFPMDDWQGATWPPNVVHKNLWNLVGGYSTEFTPGMYSDPDFSMKLWQAGVREFRGVAKSRVYHFGSISVKRVVKNAGYYTFILKWGMSAASFSKHYLRRGKKYEGILAAPKKSVSGNIKSIYKQIIAIFQKR